MTKNEDDFGLYLDFDDDEEDIPPIPNEPCRQPYKHNFVKKLLAQHYYYECSYCGYSPEHDANKPKFKECHIDYIIWKKTMD
jgi:hypothetical protein